MSDLLGKSNLSLAWLEIYTVNVEIFAQYIFSRILRSALDARKYDVSEKMKRYRSNRINYVC